MTSGNIKINVPENEREQKLLDAIWVLANLRKYKKVWETHFGSEHRKRLKAWEDRADNLLKDVGFNIEENEK